MPSHLCLASPAQVETGAIGEVMPGLRMYGMFAHGELGPSSFKGFSTTAAGPVASEQHSMTSILAIHTEAAGKD